MAGKGGGGAAVPIRNFDLRDELRATAERRKRPQPELGRPLGSSPSGLSNGPSASGSGLSNVLGAQAGSLGQSQNHPLLSMGSLRGEGIDGIAARLAVMFPTLPQDTIRAVLSELFRSDSSCSREELADRAVQALVEMCLGEGTPQAVTCFSPRTMEVDDHQPIAGASSSSSSSSALPEQQALHGYRPAVLVGDSGGEEPIEIMDVDSEGDATHFEPFDNVLDAQLALLMSLSDDDLAPCLKTMMGILDRIAAEPNNEKVRRLRLKNPKFEAAVGRHEAARALLKLAGFQEETGAAGDDPAIIFVQDPSSSSPFQSVREALTNIWEASPQLANILPTPALGAGASGGGRPSPSHSPPSSTNPPPWRDDRLTALRQQRSNQRARIAELTEQRLKDPNKFRAEAQRKGAANRVVGGPIRARPTNGTSAPQPSRRSQHFTLDDINRLRVEDEIRNTPNYADEYRQQSQNSAAHDYSTLVARSYDPKLISRQALDGTNNYRASKGLPPLKWNEGIAKIAAEHAAAMASGRAPFSHDGFSARTAAFPVSYRMAAENLALNKGIAAVADAAVNGWIKSPGHEKNLSGTFNLCGIGTARSADGTFYLTQLFALTS